jgi:hypothetical protein
MFVGLKGKVEKTISKVSMSEGSHVHLTTEKGLSGTIGARILSTWRFKLWIMVCLPSPETVASPDGL